MNYLKRETKMSAEPQLLIADDDEADFDIFDEDDEKPEAPAPDPALAREEEKRRWLASLEPPKYLDREAKRKWRAVVVQYNDWSPGAIDLLTLYAGEWSRWKRAEAEVAKIGEVVKSPSGYAQPNPWLSISRQAHDRLVKLSRKLGIADPR
jgi:phage terminase small subunit